jgi:hypothetical protein
MSVLFPEKRNQTLIVGNLTLFNRVKIPCITKMSYTNLVFIAGRTSLSGAKVLSPAAYMLP